MPIYAYRCESCGAKKDVLQKLSDAPLTVCPVCGTPTFRKQLSAPAFQLKGTGWYVTDFRDSDKPRHATNGEAAPDSPTAEKSSDAPDGNSAHSGAEHAGAEHSGSTHSAASESGSTESSTGSGSAATAHDSRSSVASSGAGKSKSSGSAPGASTKTPVA